MRAKAKNNEEQVEKMEPQVLEAIKAYIGSMDDASPPGQKKPEVHREEGKLLSRVEDQGVKDKLDWGLEGLGPEDTPTKVKGDNEVAEKHREPAVALGKDFPNNNNNKFRPASSSPWKRKPLGRGSRK